MVIVQAIKWLGGWVITVILICQIYMMHGQQEN